MLDSYAQESDIAAMRRLMLLRHAKTERAEPGEHDRDRDRKLTKRGRTDAPTMGAYMARHGFVPDLAIVSAARRAQETWTLLAAAFTKAPRVVNDERIYNANPEKLAGIIGETRDARTLLVVGHNPSLHDLAVNLIAADDAKARERLSENLPTSGLVVIDLAVNDWSLLNTRTGRLECFVSPRMIAAATD